MTLKYILFGCKYFELISSQSSYLNYNQWNQTKHQKCHFVLISHKDINYCKGLDLCMAEGHIHLKSEEQAKNTQYDVNQI